jgi:tetratricopeptide (TPR) repeat protein
MREAWRQKLDRTAQHLATETAKATPALKPHWLVQAGAWQFKHTRFDAAARLFQQVVDEAPQHPRAEVARLMLARTRIEKWRSLNHVEGGKGEQRASRESAAALREAYKALDAYLEVHPHGRFAPDIPGWQGGLVREAGSPAEALEYFLKQIDFTDHPEIVRRAVRECETCLEALDTTTIEEDVDRRGAGLPLEEIARRPLAALAVVYHFLDSESRRDFDDLLHHMDTLTDRDITGRYLLPALRMRRAGREVFPLLADAVVRHRETYGGAVWRPKYLAILAWAASEAGEHRQAIRVCDLAGPAIDESDDLLFVRAVALQRAGEWDAALAAFRRVQEKFPKSPLNVDTRFRIATVLRDKHEAGAAVVEMLRMTVDRVREEPAQQPAGQQAKDDTQPSLHLGSEIAQWVDTLLRFAPTPELERGLALLDLAPEIAQRLRESLRLRFLAREDFTNAKRFAEPAAPAPAVAPGSSLPLSRFRANGWFPTELAAEEWHRSIDHLALLTRDLKTVRKPAARAEKLFALAEAWSALRGRLTLPAADDYDVCHSDFYQTWSQRYRNARVAGLSHATAADEIENWDELRHAFRHYLEAADAAPGTPLAARALWRANNALRLMAELSPWSSARAFETKASDLSRQLHERLLRECPNSDEAKRLSVWWSFPPAAELRWMPGDTQNYQVEIDIAAAFTSNPIDPYTDYRPFQKRISQVAAKAETSNAAQLLDELGAIRRDFLPAFISAGGSAVINHLDDLSLFLQEPGLTPTAQTKYFAARLANDPTEPWRARITALERLSHFPRPGS